MSSSPTDAPGYFPQLDALRAVALLLVMATHWLGMPFTGNAVLDAPLALARIGWTGVDLFFVLSGFLITGILLDTQGAPNYFRGFYARRALRIFPLYYAVLLIIVLVLPQVSALHENEHIEALARQKNWWHFVFLTNVAEGMGFSNSRLLVPYWSLAVEEHFYLLWPLIVFRYPRHVGRICVWGIAGACAVRVLLLHGIGSSERLIGFLTPCRLDSLLAGGLIAVMAREGPEAVERMRRWARVLLPAGAVGVVAIFMAQEAQGRLRLYPDSSQNPWVVSLGFLILALFYGSLVVHALYGPLGVWLARRTLLVSLGRITFACYLIHEPVQVVLEALTGWPSMALSGAAFVTTIVLATISWHLFEKPILSLKRYFPRHEQRVKVPPAP